MKKLITIFTIAFLLLTNLSGQNYNDRTKKTTIKNNDGVFVHDVSANYTYGVTWQNIANYMFGYDREMTATLNISGVIQAPSSVAAGIDRAFGYNGGLFGWNANNEWKNAADRAWVLEQLVSYDITIDTNNFGLLDANNSWTGNNTFSSILLTNLTVGLIANSGKIKLPYYTSSNKPTPSNAITYFDATEKVISTYYNGTWYRFMDSLKIVSLIQSGGATLPSSGTLSGITSLLTWSSNGLRFLDDVETKYGDDNDMRVFYDEANDASTLLGSYSDIYLGTTSTNDIILATNNTTRLTLNSSGHTTPAVANTYDLGSETYPFRNAFVTQLIIDAQDPEISPNFVDGLLYRMSGANSSKVFLKYLDGVTQSTTYLVNIDELADSMDNRLYYAQTTTEVQVQTYEIDFSNKNVIPVTVQAKDEQDLTLTITNFDVGLPQKIFIEIDAGNSIICSFGSLKKYWSYETPIAIDADGVYAMWFAYKSATEITINWDYYGPVQ